MVTLKVENRDLLCPLSHTNCQNSDIYFIKMQQKINNHAGNNCPAPETIDHGTWECKLLDAPMDFPISVGSTWTCELETPRKSKYITINQWYKA